MIKLRPTFVGCLLSTTLVFGSEQPSMLAAPKIDRFETRCGWFDNPTPANVWLVDRDGTWIIGEQGGYQVESNNWWPLFTRRQWVETNVHYGYGCACLRLRVDRETRRVLEIKSSRAQPLAACRRDPKLERR